MSDPEEWARYKTRRQSEAIEKALTLPLLDAAFHIVLYNQRFGRSNSVAIDLSAIGLPCPLTTIAEAEARATVLILSSYDVGDACLSKDPALDQIVTKYRAANPGFGDDNYSRAIDHGCYVMR